MNEYIHIYTPKYMYTPPDHHHLPTYLPAAFRSRTRRRNVDLLFQLPRDGKKTRRESVARFSYLKKKIMTSIRVKDLCTRLGLKNENKVIKYALEIARRASSRCRNLGGVRIHTHSLYLSLPSSKRYIVHRARCAWTQFRWSWLVKYVNII